MKAWKFKSDLLYLVEIGSVLYTLNTGLKRMVKADIQSIDSYLTRGAVDKITDPDELADLRRWVEIIRRSK